MPFKRHTRHDGVFLQVCRTIDNTSVLVLNMLVVGIEAHVYMYMKGQTRVSMWPYKNTFRHGDRSLRRPTAKIRVGYPEISRH